MFNLNKGSLIPFDHQTTSLGRLRPVSFLLGLITVITEKIAVIKPFLPFIKLELDSRHSNVQASALKTFTDFLVDLILISNINRKSK